MKRWPLNKANFWETAPFFRILLPFVGGIVVYDRGWLVRVSGGVSLVVIAAAFLLFLTVTYIKKGGGRYAFITFALLNGVLFFGGLATAYYSDARNDSRWFGNSISGNRAYLVRLTDNPAEKENSWKLPVAVISVVEDGRVTPVKGNVFLYLYKGAPVLLHKGDTIWTPGRWEAIKNVGNPFEFDYATYCGRNNIRYQQFCQADDIRLYATNDPDHTPFIDASHDWCMAQLDKYITDPKTKGLIQAMLLGDEVNLDEELLRSYSETGIVHIIAISGGNVAIFFIVISFLLWWLKDKRLLWVKFAIALPLVWFYVLMAGAPPSAVRAAVMFSLLAFSVMLQKNNNSLNQLFATAFLLLCAQPMWLYSVGFQLSFIAVLSLILFYSPIYAWLSPVSKIARLLWATVVASIAAEILVAPLVIYYFHIFPLLFIIANMAAYLFMGLVLILGIAIIALSLVPILAKITGIITVWIVTVVDKIVVWLQGMNPVSFHFLALKGAELILVYAVITGIVLFLMKNYKPALFIGLGAGCVLMMSFCKDEWVRLQQQRFVVYNTSKANRIERVQGRYYAVLATDTSEQKKIDYVVKPAHINWHAWEKDSSGKREIFDVNGKTALVLNQEIDGYNHFPVDYLVVNYSTGIDLKQLQRIFSPSLIIIGNNYSRKQQEKFVKECVKMSIGVHSISKDGAFVVE